MRIFRRIALQVVVSACFMALLLWRVNPRQMRDDLAAADARWLALAVPVFLISEALHGLRWWLLARRAGPVPLRDGVLARILAGGIDLVLPLHAGYAALAQFVNRRYGIDRATALGTLAAEGVTVVVAGGLLVLAAAPFLLRDAGPPPRPVLLLGGGLLVCALLAAVVYLLMGRERLHHALPERLRTAIPALVRSFRAGFAGLGSPASAAVVLLATLAEWIAAAVAFALVGRGFDIRVAPGWYLAAEIVSYASFAVPLTQGNLGPFELALTAALNRGGATRGRAAAFAVGAHAVLVIATVVGAVLAAMVLRLRRGDLFFVRATPAPESMEAARAG